MGWHGYWPIADGHADTLTSLVKEDRRLCQESERGHIDLPRLREAGVDLQVLAICSENRLESNEWTKRIISSFELEMAHKSEKYVWLRKRTDWQTWEEKGKVGFCLALEGLEPLNGRPDALVEFYQMGVRMVSLTWNHTNSFAGGALESGGLTLKGREVIAIMEELGMALDLSHLNRESFWEVIGMKPNCPILVSHGNADSLCPHPRNLTDDQIKAVAEHGGTVGTALFPPFLAGETADITDIIRHLSHIRSIGGDRCPALGCDFDGIGKTPEGIQSVKDLPVILWAIKEAFRVDADIMGALGENLYRVLRRTAV